MVDLQSVLIYFGLALLAFLVAKYAEFTDSRKAVWFIVLCMSLVAGLRGYTVGIDTKTYDSVFSLIAAGRTDQIYGIEKSFLYICRFLLGIWQNHQFLLFVFALLCHGLILFRFWQDRERIAFSWSVLSYYILMYSFSLNGMRQLVAVAIVFYATGYIKEGKYLKFTLLTLVATLFHFSALIGLGYLFFEIVFAKYFDTNRKRALFLLVAVGGVVGLSAILGMTSSYSRYFEREASSVGFMMVAKVLLLGVSFLATELPKEEEERYFCLSHRWNYFVGLLLNSLSYIILYAGRIGLYFYVFEGIYLGYLFKSKSRNPWEVLYKLVYVLVLLFYLQNMLKGSHGEMPYRFFWELGVQ